MVTFATLWRCIRPFAQPLALLLSLFFAPATTSRLVNVTVDDTFGDPNTGLHPVYSPNQPTPWNPGSPDQTCPQCKIRPSTLNLSQVYKQTWQDAMYKPPAPSPTITFSFSGSAVYVFNIVPNNLPGTVTFANISFTIDGENVGSFTHTPDNSSDILYNHLVYSNTILQDGLHTLIMSAGGDAQSLILFDYLLYTTESNSTTSFPSLGGSHSASVGAIVGAVVGGIVLALLGVVIAVSCLRIRRRTRVQPTLNLKRISLTAAEWQDTSHDRSRNSMGVYRCRDARMPGGRYFAQRTIPITPFFSPTMRPHDHSATHSLPRPLSVDYGSDVRPPLDVTPTSTAAWSSKRRAELTLRLSALHRRMSFLSSTAPSRSEFSGGSGTEIEIRELQAEIAELRRVLAGLSAQFADGRTRESDPLPLYTATT
ncbi:hypothetical protein GSI_12880 [Ganoderma sinense ZZ0214-1]|uniref:Transporter n=1 Tax=Ganoderma sinense ZZ0214-1 TaxID=1077348 RepID=A0A2G8RU17_9APHY|nr:hypothetical protein GSI_12880 [Ganoderma sinense ZZ0214-1]